MRYEFAMGPHTYTLYTMYTKCVRERDFVYVCTRGRARPRVASAVNRNSSGSGA